MALAVREDPLRAGRRVHGAFIAKIVLVAAVIMYFAWKLSTARGFPIVLIILAF